MCEATKTNLNSDDAATLEDDGLNEHISELGSTLHRDDKISLILLLQVILMSKNHLELVEASQFAVLLEQQKWLHELGFEELNTQGKSINIDVSIGKILKNGRNHGEPRTYRKGIWNYGVRFCR